MTNTSAYMHYAKNVLRGREGGREGGRYFALADSLDTALSMEPFFYHPLLYTEGSEFMLLLLTITTRGAVATTAQQGED